MNGWVIRAERARDRPHEGDVRIVARWLGPAHGKWVACPQSSAKAVLPIDETGPVRGMSPSTMGQCTGPERGLLMMTLAKSLYDRFMSPLWRLSFQPHIVDARVAAAHFRFFVATRQAAAWYAPPRAHALVEYEWILEHVALGGRQVVDVGAHHGYYSMLLAAARPAPRSVTAVEPLPSNCAILEVNAALNGVPLRIVQAAVTNRGSSVRVLPRGNSRLSATSSLVVEGRSLRSVAAGADIVKMDIEGAEFEVLPSDLVALPSVTTWIVEVHVPYGDPAILFALFEERGFAAHFLDKERLEVSSASRGHLPTYSTSYFFTREPVQQR